MHKIIYDYLLVVKTWMLINLPDYKLDTLAEHFLSLGKVPHSWDFITGWNDYTAEYIFYNCIDTIILEQLHNEVKTANVWYMLASILRIELNSAFSTIKPAETVLMVHEYHRYKVFPNVKHEIPDNQNTYEGAWVVPCTAGIYRYVGGLDFASLYPSIIRQFLISPETFKYKKDVNTYKPTPDEIMTASGAVYEKKVDSMIPQILEKYYNMRKQAKGDMKTCQSEAEYLEEILDRRTKAISA
jgi:DNA polymerase elongation subunit (family B)